MRRQVPSVPYVEAQHKGSKQRPTAIVLSLSCTTSDKGAALGLANRFHKLNSPADSYHYFVDEASIFRGLFDNVAAYSSPFRSIDVHLAAQPTQNPLMWLEGDRANVLELAAELVADLMWAYKIKLRYLEGEGQSRWLKRKWRRRGGLILEIPGGWPKDEFLIKVNAYLAGKSLS